MASMRCPRCGQAIPGDRLVCPGCSPELPDTQIDPLGTAAGVDSTAFLYPNDPSVAVNLVSPRTREQTRLLSWLAVGLVVASFTTGVLYTLFYLRVGNTVSELLPRDTLAYMVIEQPGDLREAFQNLNLWTNTRPVRARIRAEESEFVSEFLLDLGVNRHVFGIVQQSVSRAHVAVLPSEGDGAPYDILVFAEFPNPRGLKQVKARLAPFFEEGGREAGRTFQIRRLSSSTVTLVDFNTTMVMGVGGTRGIRTVLANLESSQTGSLHDVSAFRTAWRQRAKDSNLFAFAPDINALSATKTPWPLFWSTATSEVSTIAPVPPSSEIQGISCDLSIHGGHESSICSLHLAEEKLGPLRDSLGQQSSVLLSAVPITAEFALTAGVADADRLFDTIQGPLLTALSELGLIDAGAAPYPWLNQLQAESGVYFRGDVLSHIHREIGVALVPIEDRLTWLLLADLQVPQRALARVSRLVTHFYQASTSERTGEATIDESGIYRALETTTEGERTTALCWTLESSILMLSPDCKAVVAARDAFTLDQGLQELPSANRLLNGLAKDSAATLVTRPYSLMRRLGMPALDDIPFAADHLVVGGLRFEADHVEINGNIPVLSALYLAALPSLGTATENDATACADLVAAVCNDLQPAECDTFSKKVSGSSATSCRTAMRTFAALQAPAYP